MSIKPPPTNTSSLTSTELAPPATRPEIYLYVIDICPPPPGPPLYRYQTAPPTAGHRPLKRAPSEPRWRPGETPNPAGNKNSGLSSKFVQSANSAVAQQTATYTIRRVTYRLAGQPIAVRVSGDPAAANNGLHYLYADHLGGINAIQRQNGGLEQMRYTPFGDYRLGNPSQLTDRAYTGQRENMNLGLYYCRFAETFVLVPYIADCHLNAPIYSGHVVKKITNFVIVKQENQQENFNIS